jgi:hypothetical protein
MFSNDRLAGIPLPVVIVWAVVKANWFTYTSTEGQHVSPSPLHLTHSLTLLLLLYRLFPRIYYPLTAQVYYRQHLIASYAPALTLKTNKQLRERKKASIYNIKKLGGGGRLLRLLSSIQLCCIYTVRREKKPALYYIIDILQKPLRFHGNGWESIDNFFLLYD